MRHKKHKISTFCSTMSYFIFPDLSLAIVFLTFYIFRSTSLLSLSWSWLVSPMGRSPISLALENYTIWVSLYSLAHLILYVEPQRSFFHQFKLNPNYPRHWLIVKEFLRSARGVAIGTIFEASVFHLHETSDLPSRYSLEIFDLSEHGDLNLLAL